MRLIFDEIFGKDNFRNEIIWDYRTGTARSKDFFANKHDIDFFYVKNKDQIFNLNTQLLGNNLQQKENIFRKS